MRFISKKRMASAALAGVLALSMATPTFASTTPEKNTTNIAGSYKAITLAVSVPTTGKAVINPYGLPYSLDETHAITGQEITTGAPLSVQNRSSVPLKVSAKLTGSVPTESEFQFDASAPSATETDKKGQVVFQMFPADALIETTLDDADVLMGGFAGLKDADALPSTPAVVSTTASDVTNIITLREGTTEGALQAGGAAFFRLTGKVAKKPEWKTTDTFNVKIAFTFTPEANGFSRAGGTVAAPSSGDENAIGNTAITMTLTPTLPAGLTPTAQNTVWSINDTTHFELVPNATDPLKVGLKAKIGTAAPSTGDPVTLTVTITDTNGIPYVATLACKAA